MTQINLIGESSAIAGSLCARLGGRPVYVLIAARDDNGVLCYGAALTSQTGSGKSPFVDKGDLLQALTPPPVSTT